jgi:uncharacterized protein (TIGR02117 family)
MSIARAGVWLCILLAACAAPVTSPWMDEVDRVGNGRSKNSFPVEDGESATGPSVARGPRLDPIGESATGPSVARGPRLDPIGAARKLVYLVSHGWHTGIVLRRADLPQEIWPESEDFPDAEYLEVGWGDRDFYQAAEFSWSIALKAALWPTPSVLHIVGFNGPVTGYFPHSEVLEVELSQRGFDRLSGFVHEHFDRKGAPRAAPLGPGLYGKSAFYPARAKFHLFNTCNVWTARALRTAGLPVTPFYAITTDGVMSQVRQAGKTLQPGLSGR